MSRIYKYSLWIILPVFILFPGLSDAQTDTIESSKVKIFLDAKGIDHDFITKNITYVDHLRDPKLADVHIMITHQQTASNSRQYRLHFIGQQHFENINYEFSFISPQSDSQITRQEEIVKQIGIGLVPFIAQTENNSSIQIKYNGDIGHLEDQKEKDKWNYWVFRLSGNISGDFEENQNSFSYGGSARADRITEVWKYRTSIFSRYNEDNFKNDEEIIQSIRRSNFANGRLIYSLSKRWSIGGFLSAYNSTYRNMDISLSIAPAIEFNFFPWDESDRKIFSIGYFVGARHNEYAEITVFNLMEETRYYHQLKIEYIQREPWGEIETSLEGSHYLHDFDLNHLEWDFDLSLRVSKGLSIFVSSVTQIVHDQLYLPKGEATLEEILLQQRDLATTFDFNASIGIRYTFGSLYNNIINPRL